MRTNDGGMVSRYFSAMLATVRRAGWMPVAVLAERGLIQKPDALIHITLILALACTAAVFWEFAEWIADHTIGTTCQLSLEDTMLDLFMGFVGGAVYAGALWARSGK